MKDYIIALTTRQRPPVTDPYARDRVAPPAEPRPVTVRDGVWESVTRVQQRISTPRGSDAAQGLRGSGAVNRLCCLSLMFLRLPSLSYQHYS